MVTALFRSRDNCVCGFLIKGHADYGEYGNDIVCAAVSSAVYLVANTITEIVHGDCKIVEKDGYFSLSMREYSGTASAMLDGLRLHLTELSKDYPQFVTITTEVLDNA